MSAWFCAEVPCTCENQQSTEVFIKYYLLQCLNRHSVVGFVVTLWNLSLVQSPGRDKTYPAVVFVGTAATET